MNDWWYMYANTAITIWGKSKQKFMLSYTSVQAGIKACFCPNETHLYSTTGNMFRIGELQILSSLSKKNGFPTITPFSTEFY
jgi:hypothetical protein